MEHFQIEGTVRGESEADVLNKLRDKVIGLKIVKASCAERIAATVNLEKAFAASERLRRTIDRKP